MSPAIQTTIQYFGLAEKEFFDGRKADKQCDNARRIAAVLLYETGMTQKRVAAALCLKNHTSVSKALQRHYDLLSGFTNYKEDFNKIKSLLQ